MTIIHHNSSDSESEPIKHLASDIVKKFHRQKTSIFKKLKITVRYKTTLLFKKFKCLARAIGAFYSDCFYLLII